MNFLAAPDADGHLVWLQGELDGFAADELAGAVRGAVRAGGPLVLEMTDLSFVDSDGIRSLLSVARRLGDRGCVILHNPTPHVAKVVGIVGLSAVPNVHVLERHADAGPREGPGAWSAVAAFRQLMCDVDERLARSRALGVRRGDLIGKTAMLRDRLAASRSARAAVSA